MKLRVLIIEDSADDAELMVGELRRAGFDVEPRRVSTAEELEHALQDDLWDLVLSDYTLPHFSAPLALERVHARGLDVPFIIVSGTLAEDAAVRAMKAGAHDFFSKDNLARLGAAVSRELTEARVRRERRDAVQELQRAEEVNRLIVEAIQDHALFVLDVDGRLRSWNAGAHRLTGWTEAEIVGRAYDLFFTPDARAAGVPARLLRDAVETGRVDDEGWRVRKDGSAFWAESSLHAVEQDKQLRGFVAVVRDVSERKRLVDDLRLAVRARDEFLTIASHELKTPITSLQLSVQGLQRSLHQLGDRPVDRGRVEARLELISRQVERITTLINNLLEVSRMTSGMRALAREPVELTPLVEEVVRGARHRIERSGSEVTVTGDRRVIGNWDRAALATVIGNLLSNALKYGAGNPVELHVEWANGRARLTVVDRGIGIPPERQTRIFERFERAVPERHYGGFGLGLWITRQAVEALGGTISVQSAPGVGARFTVELPAGDVDRPQPSG